MRTRLPGVAAAAVGAVCALLLAAQVSWLSPLVVGVFLGAVYGNVGVGMERLDEGCAAVARHALRAGIVLLGLRLSVNDVVGLGWPMLLVAVGTVVVTFFGTQALGRRLGVSSELSLLVASGYSICGASAIAAVEGSTDANESEVAAAVGLVTLVGSLAIVVLPLTNRAIGLTDSEFGAWAGASVHDVAQVVATAGAVGPAALGTAIVVKLTRVLFLAPLLVWVNVRHRAVSRIDGTGAAARPPLLPAFVVCFLAAVAIRSSDVLPQPVLDGAADLEKILLTMALVGLGTAVRWRRLKMLGGRPLVLGGVAWLLVGSVSLAGVIVAL